MAFDDLILHRLPGVIMKLEIVVLDEGGLGWRATMLKGDVYSGIPTKINMPWEKGVVKLDKRAPQLFCDDPRIVASFIKALPWREPDGYMWSRLNPRFYPDIHWDKVVAGPVRILGVDESMSVLDEFSIYHPGMPL